MHSYPELTGSYAENQRGLLRALGLNSPSQAPFRQIQSFWSSEYRAFLLSSDGSEREDLAWLRLAFSVIALHHWGEWPEINQSREPGNLTDKGWWRISFFDEPDLRFLSEFFAETWETLCKQHPSIRNLAIHKVLYFENRFDTETEDGLERLTTWLRWIVEALWENQGRGCFTETDADVRALRLVVDLLGKGRIQVVKDLFGLQWRVNEWLLQAIHLILVTRFPARRTTVMKSSCGSLIGSRSVDRETVVWTPEGLIHFESRYDKWGDQGEQCLWVGVYTYVHPGAYIGRDVTIGHGTYVSNGAHIDDGAHIGEGTRIGAGVYVGIDARIDNNVLLHGAEPGQSPIIIDDQAHIESGVIVFPNTPVIPDGATVQSGVILRPDSVFRDPNGMVITHPPSNSSIGPGNSPNTLIVRLAE